MKNVMFVAAIVVSFLFGWRIMRWNMKKPVIVNKPYPIGELLVPLLYQLLILLFCFLFETIMALKIRNYSAEGSFLFRAGIELSKNGALIPVFVSLSIYGFRIVAHKAMVQFSNSYIDIFSNAGIVVTIGIVCYMLMRFIPQNYYELDNPDYDFMVSRIVMWELIPIGIIGKEVVACLFNPGKKVVLRRIFKVKKYIFAIVVIEIVLITISAGLSFLDQEELFKWLTAIAIPLLTGVSISFIYYVHIYSFRMRRCVKVFCKALKKGEVEGQTFYFKTIPYRLDVNNRELIIEDCKGKIKEYTKNEEYEKTFGEVRIHFDAIMEHRRINNIKTCWKKSEALKALNTRREEQIKYIKERKEFFMEERRQYLESDSNFVQVPSTFTANESKLELWDAYDANLDKIDGMTLIRGQEVPDGVFHLVCEIIVRHTDGTYLLMQRAPRKTKGGMWEATADGSALRGEDRRLLCLTKTVQQPYILFVMRSR